LQPLCSAGTLCPQVKALRRPDRRGAALEMCGRYIWKRSIVRLTQRPICGGSRWRGTSTILSSQRVKTCCIPGRRVSPNARSAPIFSADMRASYNTECNAPPEALEHRVLVRRIRRHVSVLTSGDNRSAIAFSSVSSSA
jgi:hypothetical protein